MTNGEMVHVYVSMSGLSRNSVAVGHGDDAHSGNNPTE